MIRRYISRLSAAWLLAFLPAFSLAETVTTDSDVTNGKIALGPFVTIQQTTNYTCGCVSAQMVLNYFGLDIETEGALALKMHTHTASGIPGALPGSAKKLTDYGTNVGEVYNYFKTRSDLNIVSTSYNPSARIVPITQDILADSAFLALRPHFPNYASAGRFFSEQLKKGRPIMVCWNARGGHWTVVIGYDDSGTPDFFDDDQLTMADPHDTCDGNCDGLTDVNLLYFFYDWFCIMSPAPLDRQPYIVVEPSSR